VADTVYHWVNDFEGLLHLNAQQRDAIYRSVLAQVKVRPGDEARYEKDEAPRILVLCHALLVKLDPATGNVNLTVKDPQLDGVMVATARGTSWYSAVNLVGAVAAALGSS
jgi:hypothetical protein